MTKLKFKELEQYVKEQITAGKIVVVGYHGQNVFLDPVASLIQLSGYFAHVFIALAIDKDGRVETVEALKDGTAWFHLDDYKGKINSGVGELTIGVINSTPEQFADCLTEASAQVGAKYDMGENYWHAITQIITWCGAIGKVIGGALSNVNPMGDKKEYNCSEGVTLDVRYAGFSFYPEQTNAKAITPSEVMAHPLLKKDVQSVKG
jgi:hypothetical protein